MKPITFISLLPIIIVISSCTLRKDEPVNGTWIITDFEVDGTRVRPTHGPDNSNSAAFIFFDNLTGNDAILPGIGTDEIRAGWELVDHEIHLELDSQYYFTIAGPLSTDFSSLEAEMLETDMLEADTTAEPRRPFWLSPDEAHSKDSHAVTESPFADTSMTIIMLKPWGPGHPLRNPRLKKVMMVYERPFAYRILNDTLTMTSDRLLLRAYRYIE